MSVRAANNAAYQIGFMEDFPFRTRGKSGRCTIEGEAARKFFPQTLADKQCGASDIIQDVRISVALSPPNAGFE